MAAVSSVTKREIAPNGEATVIQMTCTKANAGDTIDASTTANGSFEEIFMVLARLVSAGTDDPCDWSGTDITMSANTGVTSVVIIGRRA